MEPLFQTIFEQALDPALVVDDQGAIVIVNSAVERVLGYTSRELAGRSIELLVPARFATHAAQRGSFFRENRPRPMGRGLQLFARHASGAEIPVDISITRIEVGGRRYALAAMRDLRDRAYGVESLKVQAKALYAAANGIVITERDGTIAWVNPAACTITGYAEGELVGQHTRLLKSGLHPAEFYQALWAAVRRGETWTGTIVNRRKNGTLYQEEQTIAPVVDEAGAVTHYIAIKQDVTDRLRLQQDLVRARDDLAARVAEIERLNALLHEQAIRDPLTLLYNRRFFDDAVVRDAARLERESEPLSLVVIDVDHFKRVNDRHGHAAGDLVLQTLADLLRAAARTYDLVCRMGGEEFVVVMPGASAEVAAQRAEQWRLAFAATSVPNEGGHIQCTFSSGVAEYAPQNESIHDTLRRADEALYAAKEAGRNCVKSAVTP